MSRGRRKPKPTPEPPPPPPLPTPTPPVDTSYGTILVPPFDGTEILIAAGANIQSAIDAAPSGTRFRLQAGIHPILSAKVPKNGTVLIGEYGAILDGTGWTSLDTTAAAFRAHNEGINDVTISNLEIRNMPQQGIHACGNQCTPNNTGWIIDHCYIHHNRFAVQTGSNAIIRYNRLTDNAAPSGTSGAYNIGFADNIEVLHNEIARNGAETKFGDCTRIWFHDNWVYAQTYNGTWLDGCDDTGADDAHYSVIENNVYEDIPIFSVFIEISRYVKVRNNTIRRSGWGGVQVGTAHHVLVEGNSIITPAGGAYAIQLRVDCGRQDFGALDYDLKNNTIQNNTLVGDYSGAITALVIDESLTTCDPSYLTNAKQNNWIGNHYDVSNPAAAIFAWGVNPSPSKTFAEWQALGQDLAGSIA